MKISEMQKLQSLLQHTCAAAATATSATPITQNWRRRRHKDGCVLSSSWTPPPPPKMFVILGLLRPPKNNPKNFSLDYMALVRPRGAWGAPPANTSDGRCVQRHHHHEEEETNYKSIHSLEDYVQ